MNEIWVLYIAIILDIALGDPKWLYALFSHPVVYFGKIISFFDRNLNDLKKGKTTLIIRGYITLILIVLFSLLLGMLIEFLLGFSPYFVAVKILILAMFLATRSLYSHVKDVQNAFAQGLPEAKAAVAKIVGRDVKNMSEITVTRSAIESLSENLSDGVIAPIFWFLLAGLPGLFVYKMVNTADSMIGHKNLKYLNFGRASALCDDILNYFPARLTAILFLIMALLGQGFKGFVGLWKILWSDATQHASPNAGWPEASMAYMMDIRLGGPRSYGASQVDGVWMNAKGREILHRGDITQALNLYSMSIVTLMILLLPFATFLA